MTKNTKPEALQCAANLRIESESASRGVKYSTAKRSAKELERLHAVEQEVERLRAENEALKVDKERMDWLDASAESHGFCHIEHGEYRHYAHQVSGYKTAREVIDAARTSTPQAS